MIKAITGLKLTTRFTAGALALALSLVLTSIPASAQTATGKVTDVTYNAQNLSLAITVSGVQYVAYNNPQLGNCFTISLDSLQKMQSLATSALLSGRNLAVYRQGTAACGLYAVGLK